MPCPAEPRPLDFHRRITRADRARPVLHRQRDGWRKRYAALAAAILIPAIASAAEWPAAPETAAAQADTGAAYAPADYAPPALGSQIRSDAEDSPFPADATAATLARPFVAGGGPIDRARAEQCLAMAVYYEAATEPDDGQRAVAQVVLNRVAHPAYPNTVCGVVFQGSERGTGCQFSFTCDGSLGRRPMAYWWDRADRVARAALAGFVYAPVGLATNYHATYVHPVWADVLTPVITIGAHRFYRLPGVAGLKAAFRAAYFGGEPLAAPHPRAFSPGSGSDPDPVALARAYEASLSRDAPGEARQAAPSTAAVAAPVYSAEIEARGGDALFRAGNLPESGGLSPELERSGQWLQRP